MIILRLLCRGVGARGCQKSAGRVELVDGRYLATFDGEFGWFGGPVDLEGPLPEGGAGASCSTYSHHDHRVDLARLLVEARAARGLKKPRRIVLPTPPGEVAFR